MMLDSAGGGPALLCIAVPRRIHGTCIMTHRKFSSATRKYCKRTERKELKQPLAKPLACYMLLC